MMIRKGQLTALAAAMLLCACASTNQSGMKDGTYTEVVGPQRPDDRQGHD